jgi:hypothetical protein
MVAVLIWSCPQIVGKWWRLKYRFGGKEKRVSLGIYPGISLKEASERRDALSHAK